MLSWYSAFSGNRLGIIAQQLTITRNFSYNIACERGKCSYRSCNCNTRIFVNIASRTQILVSQLPSEELRKSSFMPFLFLSYKIKCYFRLTSKCNLIFCYKRTEFARGRPLATSYRLTVFCL